jgi:hypothetical protein
VEFVLVPLETIEQEGFKKICFKNLCRIWISCRDLYVCSNLHLGDSIDDDNVDNMMEANLEDESKTYSFDDGKERS